MLKPLCSPNGRNRRAALTDGPRGQPLLRPTVAGTPPRHQTASGTQRTQCQLFSPGHHADTEHFLGDSSCACWNMLTLDFWFISSEEVRALLAGSSVRGCGLSGQLCPMTRRGRAPVGQPTLAALPGTGVQLVRGAGPPKSPGTQTRPIRSCECLAFPA